MRRREFIGLVTGAIIGPSVRSAAQQPEQPRRIGVMMQIAQTDPEAKARIGALIQSLRELKWVEGRDFQIEFRGTSEDSGSIQDAVAELLAKKPHVILAITSRHIFEIQKQARDIPLIFVNFSTPVEAGVVSSISRPSGNMTGFSGSQPSIAGKWLELLKEAVPTLERILVLMNPYGVGNAVANEAFLQVVETTAPQFNVRIAAATVRNRAEVETALSTAASQPNTGLIAMPGGPVTVERKRIMELAIQHRIPAIYAYGYYAAEGGLMSYGTDVVELWRRAGSYTYRILNGERPADLPVERPTKFELTINLKTAQRMGLEIPSSLLARADKVIE